MLTLVILVVLHLWKIRRLVIVPISRKIQWIFRTICHDDDHCSRATFRSGSLSVELELKTEWLARATLNFVRAEGEGDGRRRSRRNSAPWNPGSDFGHRNSVRILLFQRQWRRNSPTELAPPTTAGKPVPRARCSKRAATFARGTSLPKRSIKVYFTKSDEGYISTDIKCLCIFPGLEWHDSKIRQILTL